MYYTIQAANNKGADQTARMLFAFGINRFSHYVAHIKCVQDKQTVIREAHIQAISTQNEVFTREQRARQEST